MGSLGAVKPFHSHSASIAPESSAQGHARLFDLAAIVHDLFSDPGAADPSATVQLFPDDTHEIFGEPVVGGDLAVRYAVGGDMFSESNLAPVASQIADHTVQEDDTSFELNVSDAFVDPEGQQLSFAATTADGQALPSWLHFDAATGTFSGTPTNDDVGALSLQVTATDQAGLSVSQTFNLAVENTNDAPTATAGAVDAVATQDQDFSYTLDANTFADVDAGEAVDGVRVRSAAVPRLDGRNAALLEHDGSRGRDRSGSRVHGVT